MVDFTLRRAEPGDEHALALVGAATFLDAFIHDISGPDLVAHCARQHSVAIYAGYLSKTDPRWACWLVEHAETLAPIGYAVACPPDLPGDADPTDIELKRIYCLSRVHGSGAGQALFNAALSHCQSLKAPRLWLGTYEENRRAIAFYKRNGFKTVAKRQFKVGEQMFDDIVMARTL
ncbi:MAG: GNAT family N-acetyltransferase [Pseudomonadota bacterium]